jgi:anion-transporting  ArsA/GET3 family ATPase
MRKTPLLEQPLIYVTGKGGTGKTTISAAMATASAAAGRRTLVCDLAGGRQLVRAFGHDEARGREVFLNERLWSLSLDPDDALREWLQRQPGGAVVAAALGHSSAFSHFVAAAPGAKELITIGKVADLAGHDAARARYDAVFADAPSTGHALGMLAAPHEIAEAVPVGPVAEQAQRVARFLADPDLTAYVGVALPEEMPVRETVELEQRLRATLGRGLDLVVVNALYPDRFTDSDAERLRATAGRGCHEQLLHMVLAYHDRARTHAEHVRWLGQHTDAPVVTLPFIFSRELGPREYERLGIKLAAQLRPGPAHPAARQRARAPATPTPGVA